MANMIFAFHEWHETKYVKLTILVFALVFFSNLSFSVSQPSLADCPLPIEPSSYENSFLDCKGGDWDGFLDNKCCGIAFDKYLYDLGQQANHTGKIYLNPPEQMKCLAVLKGIEEHILDCGIEKLTSGGGSCSDYTVNDVVNKLGGELRSLGEDCKLLGSDEEWNNVCGACLRNWKELEQVLVSKGFAQSETDICRFSVLESLISTRIEDEKWAETVYVCLGSQNITAAEDQLKPKTKKPISLGLWLLIGGGVGIILVVFVASCVLLRKRTKLELPPPKEVSEELKPQEGGCQKISTKEIHSATNNLNVMNFIGQGIAGKVYKGILSNGKHVAVKHIVNDGHMETFVREVTSLSHVRHPNLVALLGYCEEEEECFLVYELCPNGNLSEWLFGKDQILSWIQRLEIAIDAGRGLWFLHTYPEGYIVHRDIKPTNILLGKNFEAKLSDFGLSKVIDMGQSYVSSEVRGTFGYVDPEYQKNHRVNSSGDVYSFGIVLLQILSGKKVINLNMTKPMPLDKMAKFLTKGGNITEFADPKMNGEYSTEAFDLILKLAISCTAHKQERPSMEQVVKRLENALDISAKEKDLTPPASP